MWAQLIHCRTATTKNPEQPLLLERKFLEPEQRQLRWDF